MKTQVFQTCADGAMCTQDAPVEQNELKCSLSRLVLTANQAAASYSSLLIHISHLKEKKKNLKVLAEVDRLIER